MIGVWETQKKCAQRCRERPHPTEMPDRETTLKYYSTRWRYHGKRLHAHTLKDNESSRGPSSKQTHGPHAVTEFYVPGAWAMTEGRSWKFGDSVRMRSILFPCSSLVQSEYLHQGPSLIARQHKPQKHVRHSESSHVSVWEGSGQIQRWQASF